MRVALMTRSRFGGPEDDSVKIEVRLPAPLKRRAQWAWKFSKVPAASLSDWVRDCITREVEQTEREQTGGKKR